MYKQVDAYPQNKFYTQKMVEGIKNSDLNIVCQNVFNAFGNVCDNKALIDDINKTNPLAVSLSGSGPTVFAIYENIDKANVAKEKLNKKYSVIITAPAKKGIEIE
jgi:4-diphosphocytidyl-2C-methyl-D-erythritol kinase